MIHFIKINPLHLLLPILASSVFLSCKDDLTIAIQPVPGSDDEVLVELPIELEDSEDGYALSADNTPTRATDNGSAMDVQLIPAAETRTGGINDPLMTAKTSTLGRIQVLQKMKNGSITSNAYTDIAPGKRATLKLNVTGTDECELIIFARGANTSDLATTNWTTFEVPQSVISGIATADQISNMPYLLHLKHVRVIKRDADASGTGTIQSTTGADVRLRLRRLAARLNVTWDYNVTGYELQQVSLQNYPTDYIVYPSETETTYPSVLAQFSTYIATDADFANKRISSWMPRNIRGTVNIMQPTHRGRKIAPVGSAFLRFVAVNKNDPRKKLTYRVYLGANATSDFNVHDNTNYTYHIAFKNHTEDIIQTDDRVEYQNGIPASENNNSFVSTANCFMVEPGGSFCFDPFTYEVDGATKTNDVLKGWCDNTAKGISYVKLIWQTKEQGDIGEPVMGYANSETDHSNIVDIQPVESGRDLNAAPATDKGQCRIYCRVSAGTTGGSGLIAAYGADGKILWSWHVWVTDYQPDVTGDATVLEPENKRKLKFTFQVSQPQLPMMDRNLGAMAGYTKVPPSAEERFRTHGFFYEWGRKEPFPGSYSNRDITSIPLPSTTLTAPLAGILSLYKPDGISFKEFSINNRNGPVSYRTAIQNPLDIYKHKNANNQVYWLNDTERKANSYAYFRVWGTTKGIYDPCPAGWRVAQASEYYIFCAGGNTKTGNNPAIMNKTSYTTDKGFLFLFDNNKNTTWVALSGYYQGQNYRGIGEFVYYWTGTGAYKQNGIDISHYRITTNNQDLDASGYEHEALPLRCIQEKP